MRRAGSFSWHVCFIGSSIRVDPRLAQFSRESFCPLMFGLRALTFGLRPLTLRRRPATLGVGALPFRLSPFRLFLTCQ